MKRGHDVGQGEKRRDSKRSEQDPVPRSDWIRPSERPFVRRVDDWTERVRSGGSWVLTDFLSPREQALVAQHVQSTGLMIEGYGGYDGAERQRMLLMPDDWHPEPEDFQIALLEVGAAQPTEPLNHGSVLGAVLGTGLERRTIGDIAIVSETSAYLAVTRELQSHLRQSLLAVGRQAVWVNHLQTDALWPAVTYDAVTLSVASLRIDAVLAQACHWSRSRAQDAVAGGHVSLNHTPCDRTDESVQPGDVLSVRGFGRVRIIQELGETKKERTRLEVGIIRSRK